MGSDWKAITTHFPGKNSNEVKNRFYSTLRRVGRKINPDNRLLPSELLVYIDIAKEEGRTCFCKRGRRKKNTLPPKKKAIRKNKKNHQEESLSFDLEQFESKKINDDRRVEIKTEEFSFLKDLSGPNDLDNFLPERYPEIDDIGYSLDEFLKNPISDIESCC